MRKTYTDWHWFSFTLSHPEGEPFTIQQLGSITREYFGVAIKGFQLIDRQSYKYSRFYTLNKMINIYVDGYTATTKNTVHFELTGMACDTLPELDYVKLINYIETVNGKICRIDLYVNDCSHILDFSTLLEISNKFNSKDRIISRFKGVPLTQSSDSDSITYGSRFSDTRIVIYDKGTWEHVDFPWIKVEITLKNQDDIKAITDDLLAGVPLPDITKSVLYRNLDFKIEGPQPKARRDTEAWWTEFLAGIDKRPSDRPKLKRDRSHDFDNFAKYVDRFVSIHGNKGALLLERMARQYPAQLSF